jgi:hypothetical protein
MATAAMQQHISQSHSKSIIPHTAATGAAANQSQQINPNQSVSQHINHSKSYQPHISSGTMASTCSN